MSLDVNGSAILRAIADTPAVFGIGQAKVDGLALAVVLARLKDKLATIADLRQLRGVIGGRDLGQALEQLTDKELAAFAKRLDAHHPDMKGSDRQSQRARVDAVLGGAEPAPPAPRQGRARAPATAQPKTGVAGRSKSLKAAREVAASSAPLEPPAEATQPPASPKAPPKAPRKRTRKTSA